MQDRESETSGQEDTKLEEPRRVRAIYRKRNHNAAKSSEKKQMPAAGIMMVGLWNGTISAIATSATEEGTDEADNDSVWCKWEDCRAVDCRTHLNELRRCRQMQRWFRR